MEGNLRSLGNEDEKEEDADSPSRYMRGTNSGSVVAGSLASMAFERTTLTGDHGI